MKNQRKSSNFKSVKKYSKFLLNLVLACGTLSILLLSKKKYYSPKIISIPTLYADLMPTQTSETISYLETPKNHNFSTTKHGCLLDDGPFATIPGRLFSQRRSNIVVHGSQSQPQQILQQVNQKAQEKNLAPETINLCHAHSFELLVHSNVDPRTNQPIRGVDEEALQGSVATEDVSHQSIGEVTADGMEDLWTGRQQYWEKPEQQEKLLALSTATLAGDAEPETMIKFYNAVECAAVGTQQWSTPLEIKKDADYANQLRIDIQRFDVDVIDKAAQLNHPIHIQISNLTGSESGTVSSIPQSSSTAVTQGNSSNTVAESDSLSKSGSEVLKIVQGYDKESRESIASGSYVIIANSHNKALIKQLIE